MPTLKISEYWKGIIAALVPVALLIQAAISDSSISGDEGVKIGLAIIGAVGVVWKANRPKTPSDVVPGYQRQDQRKTI